MPPKGSKKSKGPSAELPEPPSWYDKDVVKLFLTLHDGSRRGHKIFSGLKADDEFEGLDASLGRWWQASGILNSKYIAQTGHANRLLQPHAIVQLIMNGWITNSDPTKGLFVHWLGTVKEGHKLPIYFLMRTWSEQEVKHYHRQTPSRQMKITSAALPWFLESSALRSIGIIVLMPSSRHHEDVNKNVAQYEYTDVGAMSIQVVLLWISGSIVFANSKEMLGLGGPPTDAIGTLERLKRGGPYHRAKARGKHTSHEWWLPLQTSECRQWVQERTMNKDKAEESIMQQLHDMFWDDYDLLLRWPMVFDQALATNP